MSIWTKSSVNYVFGDVNIASGPKAPGGDEPIARLQMASDLLAFGRDNKDPLFLIVAARIMKALGGGEVDLKPDGESRDGEPAKIRPIGVGRLNLVEARDLAKGEKITNLLIDETAAMGVDGGSRASQNPSRYRPARRYQRL